MFKVDVFRVGRYRLAFGYVIGLLCLILVTHELFLPGIAIAAVGIIFRIWAAGCLRKNQHLVISGPYALCRNPLYLGSFLLGAGAIIAIQAWWLLTIYVVGFWIFYGATIAGEERALAGRFGGDYLAYRMSVPCLLPWRFHLTGCGFSFANVVKNKEHRYAAWSISLLLLLELAEEIRAFLVHHGGLGAMWMAIVRAILP